MDRRGWLCLAALATITTDVTIAGEQPQWSSDSGSYTVSFESSVQPIEINRMHEWILHVETADGEPVIGAELTVDGGMPAHNHGLPTRPRVTVDLGNGDYRVRGLRFHMRGEWQVRIGISVGGRSDTAIITLNL